ncbi:MAG: response regulator, partial [Halobacteriovoraceae bacterium]|nr:response regulator [Halobacteriovoraceae bacterium]
MKVLVVDDSIVYRSAISKALEEVEGLTELKTASNGKIALDLIKQGDYDLATIDIEMPVMDGITAIQEIRKFNKQIKIICFSSLTMNGAQKTIEALNAGANDFAAKVTDAENIEEGIELVRRELVQKVLSLTELKRVGPATSRKAKKSYAGGA